MEQMLHDHHGYGAVEAGVGEGEITTEIGLLKRHIGRQIGRAGSVHNVHDRVRGTAMGEGRQQAW